MEREARVEALVDALAEGPRTTPELVEALAGAGLLEGVDSSGRPQVTRAALYRLQRGGWVWRSRGRRRGTGGASPWVWGLA